MNPFDLQIRVTPSGLHKLSSVFNVHPTGQSEQITLQDLTSGQTWTSPWMGQGLVWSIVPVVKAAMNFSNFILKSLEFE